MTKLTALLISPQFLAALRNVLSAFAGALALFGIMTFSPASIDKIVEATTALGTLLGALTAFMAIAVPAATSAFAWFKAGPLQQLKSAGLVANDPTNANAPNVKAAMMTEAVKAAGNEAVPTSAASDAAKIEVINEVAKLAEVDKVVAPSLAPDTRTEANVTVS